MTTQTRIQIGLAGLLITVSGVIAWQVIRLREPVYQKKSLSTWLKTYDQAETTEAQQALQSIGTNAIPFLLDNLRARDSVVKLKLATLGLPYTPAAARHIRAERAFSALGEQGSNAAPSLSQIYEDNASPSSRRAAGNSLVEIGPAARVAIPALIRTATSTNAEVRAFAVYTLGRMALETAVVIPVLLKALQDPDREVRYNAAFGLSALAFMGGDAKAAVPALVDALKDSYGTARAAAALALGHIHSQSDLVIPALVESLRDQQVFVRSQAAAALGEFGTNAKSAFPSLVELTHDENQDVRNAAITALRAIERDAVRNLKP